MERIYRGQRTPSGVLVTVNGRPLGASASMRLHCHSPDGFEWGYGGSGPAQLALALLLDAYGNPDFALEYYQAFKWAVVSKLKDEWTLTLAQIYESVQACPERNYP